MARVTSLIIHRYVYHYAYLGSLFSNNVQTQHTYPPIPRQALGVIWKGNTLARVIKDGVYFQTYVILTFRFLSTYFFVAWYTVLHFIEDMLLLRNERE